MSLTSADIALVTQVLDDDPLPDYLQHQACIVEELGMQVDLTRRQLDATRRHLQRLVETMSREEDQLLLLCKKAQREKEKQRGAGNRSAAADRRRLRHDTHAH